MTSGNHHGAAVAGADIGQRQQDINLSAHETTVEDLELIALDAAVAARVQSDRLSGLAAVCEVLVDEQRAVVIVEGALAADEVLDLLDPGGVVDELFEGLSGLVDLLQVESHRLAVRVGVDVPIPLARLELRYGVETGVEVGDLFR